MVLRITQRKNSVETGSTITINSSDNADANVTIKDINIKSSKDAIDVKGSSSANITLEGDNKIFSETGSALHVSDGNVTINGSGSLKAEIQDEPDSGYNHNAKIGSHENEDMSGSIHITGDATVKTDDNIASNCGGDGAGAAHGAGRADRLLQPGAVRRKSGASDPEGRIDRHCRQVRR